MTVVPVPVGLQDQKDVLDQLVQRGRRDESPPAQLMLLPQRAPEDPPAPVERSDILACREKMAVEDLKVRYRTLPRS